ncbi:hypothetical protein JFU47_27675 [Pseudomonas sp. TH39(2020)]|uniref:hypothetical protein n=1 Tax=Pseudomonas sp. TH39(2020) TaxID=2796349 RepID=UPI001913FB4F|nr:hypothetical protein [Pseudomonas sp. TH39(2020)]MBK5400453.1 hypothetical protein [Pseudomonas sp. TH39(2020)]
MPIIPIEPIEVTTSKGYKAVLTGINPASTDTIVGKVQLPDGKEATVRWDLSGLARDNDGSFNIRMNDDESGELDELKETAKHFMLPHVKKFL